MNVTNVTPSKSLQTAGLHNLGQVYWNPTTAHLYEELVQRREGHVAHLGPVVVRTGSHTGRNPNDRFIVQHPASAERVWWSKENRPFEPERFDALRRLLSAYLQGSLPGHPLPVERQRVVRGAGHHRALAPHQQTARSGGGAGRGPGDAGEH